MKLDSIRRDYKYAELNKNDAGNNPDAFFDRWLEEALKAGLNDATSMSVATLGVDGFPQSRIVLLKDHSNGGFTFFTNYNSHKGKEILNHPKVALHFFWAELERQVRITGTVCKTTTDISEKYFRSRPVDSQIAAAVSDQSSEVPSRHYLEEKFDEMKNQLSGKDPERPQHWGGFTVTPIRFEFWQGRENRLHDRLVYERMDDRWTVKRLAP